MTHLYPGTPFSLPAIRLDSATALSALIWLAFLPERMAWALSRVVGKCNYSNPLRTADVIGAKPRARMHYSLGATRGSTIQALCEPTGRPRRPIACPAERAGGQLVGEDG